MKKIIITLIILLTFTGCIADKDTAELELTNISIEGRKITGYVQNCGKIDVAMVIIVFNLYTDETMEEIFSVNMGIPDNAIVLGAGEIDTFEVYIANNGLREEYTENYTYRILFDAIE